MSLDIEKPSDLVTYLRQKGHIGATETVVFELELGHWRSLMLSQWIEVGLPVGSAVIELQQQPRIYNGLIFHMHRLTDGFNAIIIGCIKLIHPVRNDA